MKAKMVMNLKDVRKLVEILQDKACLDMHNEVGIGPIFTENNYDQFLEKFDERSIKLYIKKHSYNLLELNGKDKEDNAD